MENREQWKEIAAALRRCRLFAGAGEATLAAAAESPLARVEHYPAGALLFEGRRLSAVGLVLEGEIRVSGGGGVPLNRLRAGDCFGFAGLFAGEYDYPTTVTADTPARLLWLPEALMRGLLAADPALALSFLTALSEKIRFLNGKIAAFTAGSAAEKLALYLEQYAAPDGSVRVGCSMSELAKRLDMGRASLYRAFEELERAGRLRREGDTFLLLANNGL